MKSEIAQRIHARVSPETKEKVQQKYDKMVLINTMLEWEIRRAMFYTYLYYGRLNPTDWTCVRDPGIERWHNQMSQYLIERFRRETGLELVQNQAND